MMFRELSADEIECRIGQVSRSGNGLSILLYKDARCDMRILDETVGAENWQSDYYECKGTLFCKVGIRCQPSMSIDGSGMTIEPSAWVWKSNAGAPSNMEAQKGEASDAFKRACFTWGIGRELYTAPRIWVPSDRCSIRQGNNGKYQCYDGFSVAKIKYDRGEIVGLAIRNDDSGKVVYTYVKHGYGKESGNGAS